jgi:uncharacterized protein (TIGR00297 family)
MLPALLVAVLVAALAWAAGALTTTGALAAVLVGTLCVLAGWGWAVLLILYFVVAVAFSKLGAASKARRTGGIVAKAGRRDAVQVLANGGVFALAAFLSSRSASPSALFAAAAAGALAASAADTLATEIGTLFGGEPRSLTTWRAVPTGTSGGVSIAGSLAMVGGAILVALAAFGMRLAPHAAAVALGGVGGAIADSLLGALVQERRHCPRCDVGTERRVHDCGTATEPAGGIPWLDNDGVNLCATLVGAVVAAALAVV